MRPGPWGGRGDGPLDLSPHRGGEGGLEQVGAVVPGAEEIGDEVHPVVETDPVDGPAVLPVGGGPVEVLEQIGQVVDHDRAEIAGEKGLSRHRRHIVVQPRVPSGVTNGAQHLGHQVPPEFGDGGADGVEDGVHRLVEGGADRGPR